MNELGEKRRRLRAMMTSLDLDAAVLRSPGNFAWYTGGGQSHVLSLQDIGVADLIITADGERLVVPRNEVDRLLAEELGAVEPVVDVVGWAADRVGSLPHGPRVGFDLPPPGERDISQEIESLRRSLTPEEVDRFRALGSSCAAVFTDVLTKVDPTMTERQVGAAVGAGLLGIGADPIVLLVAGAARVGRHRHPLATNAPLGDLAMVVTCARRGGLVAALTRFVSFGGLIPALADAYDRLLNVEQVFLSGTRPGADVGHVFRAGAASYAAHGFAGDEADCHHQGGPIGYFARDYVATAASDATVQEAQAFAWNPSVPSLKVEDTVLARTEGLEVLTTDIGWPSITVGGVARPAVLCR